MGLRRRRARWSGIVLAVVLGGCAGASGGAVTAAVLNTGIAAATSAHERSKGGCYASCPTGTSCNRATGYCDRDPCDGRCSAGEFCDTSSLIHHCVRGPSPSLEVQPASATAPADAGR